MTGYSASEAYTIDAAIELARLRPVLAAGGSGEVCETFAAM